MLPVAEICVVAYNDRHAIRGICVLIDSAETERLQLNGSVDLFIKFRADEIKNCITCKSVHVG